VEARDQLLEDLRARDRDPRVVAAVAAVPRELFIAPALQRFAYTDRPLPIGGGQTISQPSLVARMCELLELCPGDIALDVGAGSGYHAALLSRLCRHVYAIELDDELATHAARSLELAGIDNVTVVSGDGAAGLPEHAPFEAINVAATASGAVPATLEGQLAVGGRLIAPVDRDGHERLLFVRRTPDGYERTPLDAVRFVPLR